MRIPTLDGKCSKLCIPFQKVLRADPCPPAIGGDLAMLDVYGNGILCFPGVERVWGLFLFVNLSINFTITLQRQVNYLSFIIENKIAFCI